MLARSRDGVLLGVCGGLARGLDVRPAWVRAAAVGGAVLVGFWPAAAAYVAAAFLMPRPSAGWARDGWRR